MDRNRVRNYKSGASKRRKLKENDMKSSEELTKMKRMEQYFNKNTSNDNNNINEDEPCNTSSDEVSNLTVSQIMLTLHRRSGILLKQYLFYKKLLKN